MDIPRIRYTKTADGVNIAYLVVGKGPFDLLPRQLTRTKGLGDGRLYAVLPG